MAPGVGLGHRASASCKHVKIKSQVARRRDLRITTHRDVSCTEIVTCDVNRSSRTTNHVRGPAHAPPPPECVHKYAIRHTPISTPAMAEARWPPQAHLSSPSGRVTPSSLRTGRSPRRRRAKSGKMQYSPTPQNVGCMRLALSVTVAHERRERHEGARRYDGRLFMAASPHARIATRGRLPPCLERRRRARAPRAARGRPPLRWPP
jgi:hypothetical protein